MRRSGLLAKARSIRLLSFESWNFLHQVATSVSALKDVSFLLLANRASVLVSGLVNLGPTLHEASIAGKRVIDTR